MRLSFFCPYFQMSGNEESSQYDTGAISEGELSDTESCSASERSISPVVRRRRSYISRGRVTRGRRTTDSRRSRRRVLDRYNSGNERYGRPPTHEEFWPPSEMFNACSDALLTMNPQLLHDLTIANRRLSGVVGFQSLSMAYGRDMASTLFCFYILTNGTLRARLNKDPRWRSIVRRDN